MPALNAVVAHTVDLAKQYVEAFGLNQEDWATFAICQAVVGRGFNRVVFLRPHRGSGGSQAMVEREIEHWYTRLHKDGTINII
jgi:hypothetical protein